MNRPASLRPRPELLFSSTTSRTICANIAYDLWGYDQVRTFKEHAVYFRSFATECDAWRLSGGPIAIQTYRDFLDLVKHLKAYRQYARSSPEISSCIPPNGGQANSQAVGREGCENAIYLTVSLWLMISPASPDLVSFPGRSILSWNKNDSLDVFIEKTFPRSPTKSPLQWPQSFNLHNLDRIGGFEIIWTNHLPDHLYLNDDMRTISVFHHASVLQGLQNKGHGNPQDQILPPELLHETLQTLALLLPRAKGECKSWFENIQRRYDNAIDPKAADLALGNGGRAHATYTYWYDRLCIIQRAYDESEPKSLSQWWNDRRKKMQWYTFLIAILVLILTIVFGMIQSVTGIMQVYAAYHPVQKVRCE